MSLLLDALNKADQERKRGDESPNINSNHDVQTSHGKKNVSTVMVIVIAGLLVSLLIGVYWLGKKNQQPVTEKNTSPAKTQPVANPQQAIIAQQQEQTVNTSHENTNHNTTSSAQTNNAQTDDESIASLYQHQATNAVPIIPSNTTVENDTKPQAAISSAAATSPTTITQFANLPDIQDLPSSILQRIPSLKYSEHNYNVNGGNVVINGVVRHPNDQLVDGLFIDKILEDGMILHFENYSFKMRAMNTWINM